MFTKTLYNLHIYTNAEYKKKKIHHACAFSICLQVFIAVLTHICNVLLSDLDKLSGFEYCFWFSNCIEIPARPFDNVKTLVFSSFNVHWWSLINNIVYWNFLRSIKAAFLEVEKTMFTVATRVPMFTTINLGFYARSKKSKTFLAECNLKSNCEKKCLW